MREKSFSSGHIFPLAGWDFSELDLLSNFFEEILDFLEVLILPLIGLGAFLWNRFSQRMRTKEYALTPEGVYARGVGKKGSILKGVIQEKGEKWQRLGTWKDFRTFERGEGRIILKGRSRFSRSIALYTNEDLSTSMRIVEVVSQYISR